MTNIVFLHDRLATRHNGPSVKMAACNAASKGRTIRLLMAWRSDEATGHPVACWHEDVAGCQEGGANEDPLSWRHARRFGAPAGWAALGA